MGGKVHEKGSILHKSSPFVAMISRDHIKTHCNYCFKRFRPHQQHFRAGCKKCKLALYCSQECLDRDSDMHALECGLFGTCLPTFDAVRMMVRLLNKLNHLNGWADYDLVFISSQKCELSKRAFSQLLSHKEEMFHDPKTLHAIQGVHRMTLDYLGADKVPHLDEFAEIYGRMAINGFEICDELGSNRGWAIYLGASVLDHSCCPNANAVFEGRNLIIRSLQEIPSHLCADKNCQFEDQIDLGKQVTISYIDVMEHSLVRQRKLEEQYFFLCKCHRCLGLQLTWKPQKDLDMHFQEKISSLENLMYSIRCQNCPEGYAIQVGPGSTLEELQPDKCQSCDQVPSEEVLLKYTDVKCLVEESLEMSDIPQGLPQKLVVKMTGLFFPQHILYVKASELAFEDCYYAKMWSEAADFGELCLNSYRKFTIDNQIWGNMGLLSYRLAHAYEHLGPKYEEKSVEMYKDPPQTKIAFSISKHSS